MPDDPKLAEFREKNIELMKQLSDLTTKYEGVDPDDYKALKAKAAAGDGTDVAALRAELATEKATRVELQKKADTFQIESAIGDAFVRAGGRPEARAFVVAQGAGQFSIDNGKLKSNRFSPDRPGEPMSLDEWLTIQTRENAFCFMPSGGGGADPKRGGGTSGVRELLNPTPQDLGRYAKDIADGKLKVVYSS